ELRLALVEERADRLGNGLAERRHDLLAILVLDGGLLGGDLERAPHAALGEAHSPRRERGDLRGALQGAFEQARVLDDLRDEPDRERLLRADAAARAHQ